MRAVVVIVADIISEQPFKMALDQRNDVIQQVVAQLHQFRLHPEAPGPRWKAFRPNPIHRAFLHLVPMNGDELCGGVYRALPACRRASYAGRPHPQVAA